MKALITGGDGWLARHLAKALAPTAEVLVSLHRDEHAVKGEHYTDAVWGDICDAALVDRVTAQYEVDTLFHLAAQTDVRIAHAEPLATWEANIRGTWNVLESARTHNVGRVIVASTDKAYGWTPPPYKESDPLRASGVYETSKSCCDMIAQSYAQTYGMSIAITRCGNFYGPGRFNWSTLIPGTIKSILEKKKPVLRTDGTFRRDFMHIDDGVSAYTALAGSKATGAFNFGTGKPELVIDVVRLICEMMDWQDGIEIIPTAKGEIVDQYLDTTRARTELGWEARIPFAEGLRQTIDWYRRFFASRS